jgi:hypothetical protein
MRDRVSTERGGMRWIYSGSDDATMTMFDFADGYVINV